MSFLYLYGPPVLVMAFLAIIFHIRLMETPRYRGWWGEYKVNLILRLCLSGEYTVMANGIYRGQHKDDSTQVDHLVISRFGIVALETKSLKGKVIFDPATPHTWTQIVGRRRYSVHSPHQQNYAHIKAVQRITGVHSNKIQNFVVMAGSASFEGPVPERVFTAWQVVRKIQSMKTPVMSRAAVHSVTTRLRRYRIKGGYWAAQHHISRLRQRSSDTNKKGT